MTSSKAEAVLLQSGVKFRCACGKESNYQRVNKLPYEWDLRFVLLDGKSVALYLCPDCVTAGRRHETKEQTIEELRAKLTRGRSKKR